MPKHILYRFENDGKGGAKRCYSVNTGVISAKESEIDFKLHMGLTIFDFTGSDAGNAELKFGH